MATAMDVDLDKEDDLKTLDESMEDEAEIGTELTPENSMKSDDMKQRFTVKRWDGVALWAWDLIVDNCAICRNQIMEPCIECQAHYLADELEECSAAWGACGHAYHFHCISRWLKARQTCPLDNKTWEFQKYGN